MYIWWLPRMRTMLTEIYTKAHILTYPNHALRRQGNIKSTSPTYTCAYIHIYRERVFNSNAYIHIDFMIIYTFTYVYIYIHVYIYIYICVYIEIYYTFTHMACFGATSAAQVLLFGRPPADFSVFYDLRL